MLLQVEQVDLSNADDGYIIRIIIIVIYFYFYTFYNHCCYFCYSYDYFSIYPKVKSGKMKKTVGINKYYDIFNFQMKLLLYTNVKYCFGI